MLFIDAKTAKWDTCAGEAIILALGGYSIKPNLIKINYCAEEGLKNKEGFLFTLSEEVYTDFVKVITEK